MKVSLYLAFTAMLIQIAVFLQPLLPENYQISLVCDTIAESIISNHPSTHEHHHTASMMQHEHAHSAHLHDAALTDLTQQSPHQHDVKHQCIFCAVYGHLISFVDLKVKEVLVRIQVRLLFLSKLFKNFYFALQQLFLLPQNRAPPVLFSI